ncbi:hypothetical protein Lepto7376_3117 [[Leptolyngbya] sp. PCC 7376]|uniref:Pepco domain-containing protein n=1 Tax=[Leptolyngbya] sp. PCC 7376 TaxID=111781 RepID=UPI00029F3A1D|nr:hypothetical protein [[Leptolyngbya] sp. PCC 7376]AFY39354.1 hypothetical protein Lepto7376_3117 [[Leptolyngbya] sp. PCC 7376]
MNNDKIYIVTETPESSPTGGRNDRTASNPFDDEPETKPIQVGNKKLKRVPIDAKLLKAQMSGMIATLETLFEEAEHKKGLSLSEVQLSVEINGEGEVSILGSGATLGNTGAITMTFTRQ